jgi:hypothetical protein
MDTIKLTTGEVRDSGDGTIRISLAIDDAGAGKIHVHACQPVGKKYETAYLILHAQGWSDLKAMIAETDDRIEKLKATGQLKVIVDGFHLSGAKVPPPA